MSDARRMDIRERIEAGQIRQDRRERSALALRAEDARDSISRTAKEHPFLLIAGGLLAGVAVSMLFPKSPTRKYGKYAFAALTTAAELGMAYSRQALETAGDAAEDAVQAGKQKAGKLKRNIEHKGTEMRDVAAEWVEERR